MLKNNKIKDIIKITRSFKNRGMIIETTEKIIAKTEDYAIILLVH